MTSTTLELADHRDALIDRLCERLFSDERVVAAWLCGSLGRRLGDAWSDIDIVVLTEHERYSQFWNDRQTLFDSIGPQVFHQRPIPGNSMIPGGNFQLVVFAGPVEIDWTIAPATSAVRPSDTRLLFERRPIFVAELPATTRSESESQDRIEFFWAMAPVAVKYTARDDMLRVAGMISVLRETLHAVNEKADRPKLTRLNRQIALVEIQRLCLDAIRVGDDRKYIGIAGEVEHL
ncbi:MAG: hypothetical protein ACRDHN_08890, partial [Thermomicrobiales bacterium]